MMWVGGDADAFVGGNEVDAQKSPGPGVTEFLSPAEQRHDGPDTPGLGVD